MVAILSTVLSLIVKFAPALLLLLDGFKDRKTIVMHDTHKTVINPKLSTGIDDLLIELKRQR